MNGTRTCQISDCEARPFGRGYCSKHYQRLLKHGDPLRTDRHYAAGRERAAAGESVSQRLARYGTAEGECLVWSGGRTADGYGAIRIDGRMEGAHRAAWIDANGDIAPGLVVRHKCDNPPCLRLDHLELGTRGDNMRDWLERGRSRGVLGGAA